MDSSPLTSRTKRETVQKMFTVAAAQYVITRSRTGYMPAGQGHSGSCVSARFRSSALLAGLVLCGCGSYTKPDNAASRSPSELSLHVESHGNDLRLTWNRHAPLFANATGGILIIEDGDQPKREMPLSAAILQTGSVLYQPTSKNVRFRLQITSTHSATISREQSATADRDVRVSGQVPDIHVPDRPKPEDARPSTSHPVTSAKSRAERIARESSTRARVQPLPDSHDTGIATFYNPAGQSATKELAAACARLPVGSRVRVTNLANGRTVVLPVVRPGASARGEHIINVSYRAAEELGFVRAGTARVRVEPE
jgi:rare lipoprotein A (peptidoglycan hydrolase)